MKSSVLSEFTQTIKSGTSLSKEEVSLAVQSLAAAGIKEEEKFSFLKSLAERGETTDEFSAFVNEFRKLASDPEIDDLVEGGIDLCGTGGDKSGSFNISSAVSFLLAAAGIPVIKHGNRSITSKCGSADLIEASGIPLQMDKNLRRECLKRFNFCFLFAPAFHPAFKEIAPVRKSLAAAGVVTVFNRLGPTLNPACPPYQLLGVYDPAYQQEMANALSDNGGTGGWIVHGKIEGETGGIDELTSCGDNLILGYGSNQPDCLSVLSPSDWGQQIHPLTSLSGGDVKVNLKILSALADGAINEGLLATVLINAAAALKITHRVASLPEGVSLAKSIIQDGVLKKWLIEINDFFGFR
jgi:anthranilate phosphoribosyltransferase